MFKDPKNLVLGFCNKFWTIFFISDNYFVSDINFPSPSFGGREVNEFLMNNV